MPLVCFRRILHCILLLLKSTDINSVKNVFKVQTGSEVRFLYGTAGATAPPYDCVCVYGMEAVKTKLYRRHEKAEPGNFPPVKKSRTFSERKQSPAQNCPDRSENS